ncbi:MAG: hypothetical protein MZV70_37105 [Desulfobacterales bacterium]|nr:hypothetical protein [Desulfobacterales bacterium]
MDSFITIGMIPGHQAEHRLHHGHHRDSNSMEEELEQARKMAILGEMSAHVAHEVRNPLQKIKTGVELLSNSLAVRRASAQAARRGEERGRQPGEVRHPDPRMDTLGRDQAQAPPASATSSTACCSTLKDTLQPDEVKVETAL